MADLIGQDMIALNIASAYTTLAGSKLLLDLVEQAVGAENFRTIPKKLVTCFDFGITEPGALQHWLSLTNSSIRVAGKIDPEPHSVISSSAFHPKLYAFKADSSKSNILVGSANLTSRGFTVNSEVAWSQRSVPERQVQKTFSMLTRITRKLTHAMLDEYENNYVAQASQSKHPEGTPVPPFTPNGQLQTFREALRRNLVNPSEYTAMWLDTGTFSGGSRSQLELPRGGHQFFSLQFDQYDSTHVLQIGGLDFRSGSLLWSNRPLTWHGNNRMERLNLPTREQGGPNYDHSVVMFRRLDDSSFELIVTPQDSELANAWLAASAQSNSLFFLGTQASTRRVGLIR